MKIFPSKFFPRTFPHPVTRAPFPDSFAIRYPFAAITVVMSLAFAVATPALAQREDGFSSSGTTSTSQPLDLISQENVAEIGSEIQPETPSNANAIEAGATVADDGQINLTNPIDLLGEDNGSGNAPADASDDAGGDASVNVGDNAGANQASEDGTVSTNTTTGASVTLGRRSVSDVGLAAIGVSESDGAATNLDSLIWRGTSASRAKLLLDQSNVTSTSPVLSALSYHVVARQSVPPIGANNIARDLVNARLGWLAAAGRSNDLAVLVTQLPGDDNWVEWKEWLVQHQLMMRLDEDACRTVSNQVTRTLEPFWHKAKVICSIVQGNLGGARFGADILRASGIEDRPFFAIVDEMLNGVTSDEIDPSLLEPLHIALMDAAHREISLDGLSALSERMAQSIVGLRYLSADARMVSTFNAMTLGLIDTKQAAKLWRNIATDADNAELALARHASQPAALTTAMAWRALDAEKSPARLPLIAAAMDIDRTNGNGALMMGLYAGLARTALGYADAAVALRDDQSDAAGKIALLLALDDPQTAQLPSSFPTYEFAHNAAKLLGGLDGGQWYTGVLDDLNQWHLMPILDAIGGVADTAEWLDLLPEESPEPTSRAQQSLSPLLLRAIEQAAEKRRVAETILLANWLIGSTPLASVSTTDAAVVISALSDIGQTGAAKQLAREIIVAHLLENTGNADISAMTAGWALPVAVDAAAEDAEPLQPETETETAPETETETDTDSDTDRQSAAISDNISTDGTGQ